MKEDKKQVFLKLEFYILSLWLLFILVFVLTVDIPISFDENAKFIGWNVLLSKNIMPLISVICMGCTVAISYHLKYIFSGTTELPYKIVKIKDKGYDQMTFLTTYIIPLVCLNLNSLRYQITVMIMVLAIGVMFLKMKLYLGNPTLLLMNFKLYEIVVEGRNEIIVVISKKRLNCNTMIKWIRLDENTWYVKEVDNG
ncbi:MAG: anti-phage protein KwaA [Lachnospiraceae bacterium]